MKDNLKLLWLFIKSFFYTMTFQGEKADRYLYDFEIKMSVEDTKFAKEEREESKSSS